MNARIKTFSILLVLLCSSLQQKVLAGNGSANATGNWTNPSTWLFSGTPRVPQAGDTVSIPAGYTITVNSTITITGSPVGILLHGTLSFSTGKKLTLPCGSWLLVYTGGNLDPGSGGGNSNYIDICSATVWQASDGLVSGPSSLGNPPFPVKLVDFNAKYSSGKVLLDWTTATEVNNDYFLVQRSFDNLGFKDIATVGGNGTSSQAHYYNSFDDSPLPGINYYRLCQVDYDGTKSYSAVRAIRTNGKRDVIVYPNPATNADLSVLFTGSKNENYSLEIDDISGRTVLRRDDLVLQSGINKLADNGNLTLSNGTYFVSILIGEDLYHQKIVINN